MVIGRSAYNRWHTIHGIQSVAYYQQNAIPPTLLPCQIWEDFVLYFKSEGIDPLITITKEEALEIRRRIPSVPIHRTVKQKSQRHRYFVEESYKVLALIQKLRRIEGTTIG